MTPQIVAAPAALAGRHNLAEFRCAESELNRWLIQRASVNQAEGATRTFVICAGHDRVIAYYSLCAGAILRELAPSTVRRNMPEPIPVAILARLAVDSQWSGQGIGRELLRDAILRAIRLSCEMGIRALLCHAINERAKQFYLRHGFLASPVDPLTVMVKLPRMDLA